MPQGIIEVGYGDVARVKIGKGLPLAYIGGPCAIESRDHAFKMAEMIAEICQRLDIPWIFKACYDKDCRSSPDSFHGVGLEEGLRILSDVRDTFGVPVVSDFSLTPNGERKPVKSATSSRSRPICAGKPPFCAPPPRLDALCISRRGSS